MYLIIAPCFCFSGTAQGLVALLRGNLRGIIKGGGRVINPISTNLPADLWTQASNLTITNLHLQRGFDVGDKIDNQFSLLYSIKWKIENNIPGNSLLR